MVKFRFYDPDDEKPRKAVSREDADAIVAGAVGELPKAKELVAASVEETPEMEEPAAKVDAKPAPKPSGEKRGFTLEWISELGWSGNPFTEAQPRPAHEYIVDQETARQEINLFFIKGSGFGTITGEKTSGKTFILAWLAEELAQYQDKFTIYTFTGGTTPAQFSHEITRPYAKLFSKYHGKTPEELAAYVSLKSMRKLVILIDDADTLGALERYLAALVTDGHAIVVIAGTKPKAFLKDELGTKLRAFFAKDALALLEKRIVAVGGSGIEPFDEKLAQELWKASKQDVPTFLRYCHETAIKLALKQLTLEKTAQDKEHEEAHAKTPAKKVAKKGAKAKEEPKTEKDSRKKSPYDDLISSLGK